MKKSTVKGKNRRHSASKKRKNSHNKRHLHRQTSHLKENSSKENGASSTTAGSSNGLFEVMVGQKVEALDFCNIWRTGEIRLLDPWDKTVSVHYDGCDDSADDEFFELGSGRLRPAKKETNFSFGIPKADLAKQQLALASQENLAELVKKNDQKQENGASKMFAKERKVAQFRKGTFVIATWIDGQSYPAVVVRILSELSFIVEFIDGTRCALGSHCVTRTLSKTEYERLVENPEASAEILCSRLHNRAPFSPLQNPKDTAPPPRKRFRLTSPVPAPAPPPPAKNSEPPPEQKEQQKGKNKPQPSPSKKTTSNTRKSLPPPSKAASNVRTSAAESKGSRKSSAPALGGSGSGFTSKASVRSVSPLVENRLARPIRKSVRKPTCCASCCESEPIAVSAKNQKKQPQKSPAKEVTNDERVQKDADLQITGQSKDTDCHITGVGKDNDVEIVGSDEPKRRLSTRNKNPAKENATSTEKENVRKSSRQSKNGEESESKVTVASMVLASIPSSKDSNVSLLDLVSRPHSSLGLTRAVANDVTISVEETKTKTKVRFSTKAQLFSEAEVITTKSSRRVVEGSESERRGTRLSARVSAASKGAEKGDDDDILTQKCENRSRSSLQ